jgi:hypothetical protein
LTISEQSRHALHTRLVEVLGEQEAVVLMEHLPPVGWADVATKRDLDHLAALTKRDLDHFAAATKRDIEHLGIELRGEMAEMRSGLRGEIADLRSEMLTKMSDVFRNLVVSMIATSCATIGAVAGMLAIVH